MCITKSCLRIVCRRQMVYFCSFNKIAVRSPHGHRERVYHMIYKGRYAHLRALYHLFIFYFHGLTQSKYKYGLGLLCAAYKYTVERPDCVAVTAAISHNQTGHFI